MGYYMRCSECGDEFESEGPMEDGLFEGQHVCDDCRATVNRNMRAWREQEEARKLARKNKRREKQGLPPLPVAPVAPPADDSGPEDIPF